MFCRISTWVARCATFACGYQFCCIYYFCFISRKINFSAKSKICHEYYYKEDFYNNICFADLLYHHFSFIKADIHMASVWKLMFCVLTIHAAKHTLISMRLCMNAALHSRNTKLSHACAHTHSHKHMTLAHTLKHAYTYTHSNTHSPTRPHTHIHARIQTHTRRLETYSGVDILAKRKTCISVSTQLSHAN